MLAPGSIEAAIDTIAEVGFGRASLARIGERVGISKGLSMVAVVEIERSGLTADGQERFRGHADAIDEAVRVLGQHLAHYQAVGDLRADFDPNVMAVAIRAATDAVLHRYARDPDLDVDNYAREIVTIFDLATRAHQTANARWRSSGWTATQTPKVTVYPPVSLTGSSAHTACGCRSSAAGRPDSRVRPPPDHPDTPPVPL